MTEFQRIFTGAPWEKKIGYCRAVRAGNQLFISGTTAVAEDGSVYAPGDAYRQTKRCFEIIEKALIQCGAGIGNIARTRVFVTDIAQWQEHGRAHSEIFGEHPPASSIIEIKGLINKDMLVEVEADAVL